MFLNSINMYVATTVEFFIYNMKYYPVINYFILHFFFQNKSPANNVSSSSTVSSTSVAGTESTQDFFTVMLYTHMTDEALVVGARNILYKLSVDELRLKQTLTWNSVELDRDSCLVKGRVAPMRFHEIFFC